MVTIDISSLINATVTDLTTRFERGLRIARGEGTPDDIRAYEEGALEGVSGIVAISPVVHGSAAITSLWLPPGYAAEKAIAKTTVNQEALIKWLLDARLRGASGVAAEKAAYAAMANAAAARHVVLTNAEGLAIKAWLGQLTATISTNKAYLQALRSTAAAATSIAMRDAIVKETLRVSTVTAQKTLILTASAAALLLTRLGVAAVPVTIGAWGMSMWLRWTGKETMEPAGLAVTVAMSAGDWTLAKDLNRQYIDTINMVESWAAQVNAIDPIAGKVYTANIAAHRGMATANAARIEPNVLLLAEAAAFQVTTYTAKEIGLPPIPAWKNPPRKEDYQTIALWKDRLADWKAEMTNAVQNWYADAQSFATFKRSQNQDDIKAKIPSGMAPMPPAFTAAISAERLSLLDDMNQIRNIRDTLLSRIATARTLTDAEIAAAADEAEAEERARDKAAKQAVADAEAAQAKREALAAQRIPAPFLQRNFQQEWTEKWDWLMAQTGGLQNESMVLSRSIAQAGHYADGLDILNNVIMEKRYPLR